MCMHTIEVYCPIGSHIQLTMIVHKGIVDVAGCSLYTDWLIVWDVIRMQLLYTRKGSSIDKVLRWPRRVMSITHYNISHYQF